MVECAEAFNHVGLLVNGPPQLGRGALHLVVRRLQSALCIGQLAHAAWTRYTNWTCKSKCMAARVHTPRANVTLQSFRLPTLRCGMPGRGVVPVQTVGSGEVVDCSCLIAPEQWPFDCRAIDTVEGLAIDAERLQQVGQHDPALAVSCSDSFWPLPPTA